MKVKVKVKVWNKKTTMKTTKKKKNSDFFQKIIKKKLKKNKNNTFFELAARSSLGSASTPSFICWKRSDDLNPATLTDMIYYYLNDVLIEKK